MKDTNHLRTMLKTIYIDLMDGGEKSLSGLPYKKLLNELVKITEGYRAGIYVYDPWFQCYIKQAENGESQIPFKIYINTADNRSHIDVFQTDHPELNVYGIEHELLEDGLLLVFAEDGLIMDEIDWNIITEETQQLFQFFLEGVQSTRQNKRTGFLYRLSTTVRGLNSKMKILEEMKQTIEADYPDFEYELLLSQDYDTEGILSVQLIPYTDDATKRVSTEAFMTGEIQIDYREKDNVTSVYAPLTGEQGIYGVLRMTADGYRHVPDEERLFLSRFLSVIGTAMENVALYERSGRLVKDLKWMDRVTHELNSNLDLHDIATLVCNRIMEVSEASQAGIVFMDGGYEQFHQIHSASTEYFHTEEGHKFTDYITNRIINKEDVIFIGNMSERTDVTSYCSIMAIPMIRGGALEGFVVALHKKPYQFSLDTLKLVQTFIQHTSLAFSNALLKEELEKAVITDYMTQLYTRGHMDEKVIEHMITGEQGTLIFFDIDNFKIINDTYGHHIGDDIIIQVAQIVQAHITENAIACRWGGEEMAIYLPNTNLSAGLEIASSIKEAVATETEPAVTFSCGLSSWKKGKNDSARALFSRADKALYRAKTSGKNKIILADESRMISRL